MKNITYDVRLYKTEVYKGQKHNSYTVRWKVGVKVWRESFRNKAQAETFRSEINTAAKKGEAFSTETGRPVSWGRNVDIPTWYEFSLDYMDSKWLTASPGHRRDIAEALTDATEALLTTDKGAPSREDRRAALRLWAYSDRLTKPKDDPPANLVPALRWLKQNTVPMDEFQPDGNGAATARRVLDRYGRLQNGKPAAASTVIRKRATLSNALEYAIERKLIAANPLKHVRWTRPKTAQELDLRTVVNSDQADRLLTAVGEQGERGKRAVAFFALMYYAALRPEEAAALCKDNLLNLPDEGWGDMLLTTAQPRNGQRWTDTGKPRELRPLKHRADGATRPVPLHPDLVKILRYHLAQTGWTQPGDTGRVFFGPRGGSMTDRAYLAIFKAARRSAFTAKEAASPLARTPYDLRHAAVSTWLAAGVPAAQVALWAGHSVAVLLKVYAKAINGQEEEAKRRIMGATRRKPKPKRKP